MFEGVWTAEAVTLTRPEYHADSDAEEERLRGVIWKLEREQFVTEQDDPAWDAYVAGDWDRVLEIFEEDRDALRAAVERETKSGVEFRRLRVIEHPPNSYLRWELPSLRIFAECGRPVRVLDAREIAELERERRFPELMVYGTNALYHVQYDAERAPIGARKITDPKVVGEAAESIATLYARAEPVLDYTKREIDPLGPPRFSG